MASKPLCLSGKPAHLLFRPMEKKKKTTYLQQCSIPFKTRGKYIGFLKQMKEMGSPAFERFLSHLLAGSHTGWSADSLCCDGCAARVRQIRPPIANLTICQLDSTSDFWHDMTCQGNLLPASIYKVPFNGSRDGEAWFLN